MSGVVKLTLIGSALMVWGALMMIFLYVLVDGAGGTARFFDDFGNVFLATCDFVLIITGAGILLTTATARSSTARGIQMLRIIQYALALFGVGASIVIVATVAVKGDHIRTIATAVVMAVVITGWIVVTIKARALCERLLIT